MRVRLREGDFPGQRSVKGWLRADEEHVVLAVRDIGPPGISYLLLTLQSPTPVLFEAGLFDIVDPRVDESWMFDFEEGRLELMPAPWRAPDFWEKFYDRDDEAEALFKQVLEGILRRSGGRPPGSWTIVRRLRLSDKQVRRRNGHPKDVAR